MERMLVLKFAITQGQQVIEFDEVEYNKANKCTLMDKTIHITNEFVIITYQIGAEFIVSVA